ncbi:Acetylcholinesterase [Diplonema papillatum]|nr:Acetylcholinesterase [Diplonema papillatum]KAJ9464963.1 Acetylcholinesterase [Diplonema papillatum]|eukprot:gene13480-20770_t
MASLVLLAAAAAAAAGEVGLKVPPLVRTDKGWIEGFEAESGAELFLGVPFAAAPVGDLRFRAPQEPASWGGVKQTRGYKPDCLQDHGGASPVEGDEDCLYLNVYAPRGAHSGTYNYPVLVFIPGGGYWWESATDTDCPLCSSSEFFVELTKSAIVVSVAYRVGALGFLGGEALRGGVNGTTGNWGFLDQRAGLQWVRRNIVKFGGNPNNVALWGQSSGAAAVSLHMVSPPSQGLFNKVILMSGSFPPWSVFPSDAAEHAYRWFLASSGCDAAADPTACIRELTPAQIIAAQRPPSAAWEPGQPVPPVSPGCDPEICWFNVPCRFGSPFMPQIDGVQLTDWPTELLKQGNFAPVPVLQGRTRDDGRAFLDEVWDMYEDAGDEYLWEWAGITYGAPDVDVVKGLQRLYHPDNYAGRAEGTGFSEEYFAATDMSTDFNEQCTAMRTADILAARAVPVFDFLFSFDDFWDRPFVDHSIDLAYAFYRKPYFGTTPDPGVSEAFGATIASYVRNFAAAGDPNGAALPRWEPYTTENKATLNMGAEQQVRFEIVVDYHKRQCAFWDVTWEYFEQCAPQPNRTSAHQKVGRPAGYLPFRHPGHHQPRNATASRRLH